MRVVAWAGAVSQTYVGSGFALCITLGNGGRWDSPGHTLVRVRAWQRAVNPHMQEESGSEQVSVSVVAG